MKDLDKALDSLRVALAEQKKNNEEGANKFWNGLSYDEKLMAFYSVVKLICKGELEQRGTYRFVLYDVFGFDADAYALGMECGYLDLHNSIYSHQEIQEMLKEASSAVAEV
jgi:hypothetical protein